MTMSTQIELAIVIIIVGFLFILIAKHSIGDIFGLILMILGVFWICGQLVLYFAIDPVTTTETQQIYQIDNKYVIYTGEYNNIPTVFVESDELDGLIEKKRLSDAKFSIDETNPHFETIISVRQKFIYRQTKYEYIIYVPSTHAE